MNQRLLKEKLYLILKLKLKALIDQEMQQRKLQFFRLKANRKNMQLLKQIIINVIKGIVIKFKDRKPLNTKDKL